MTGAFALSAAIALIHGLAVRPRPQSRFRTAVKMMPVTLLAWAALDNGGGILLVAALALSAAGDGFLALRGQRNFLFGLAAFALAHLAYCALFAGQQSEQWTAGPVFLGGTVAILVAVAGVYRALAPRLGALRWPVAAYCAIIGAMAVTALGRGPDLLLLAGVALFAASDLVLGYETFILPATAPARRWTGPLIWFAYFAGQWAIAAALLGLFAGAA